MPMVPQWLEMALGVKLALGILLRLSKNESSDRPFWNLAPNVVIKARLPPLSQLCSPREFGPTMSYDRASATCVNTHTVT